VGAKISYKSIPVMQGVNELLAQDMAPGGAYRNLSFLECCGALQWQGEFSEEQKILLTDPQTAGGLLISVTEEKSEELEEELVRAGIPAARIGQMVHDPDGVIVID
jgi:selenide,water dikinase